MRLPHVFLAAILMLTACTAAQNTDLRGSTALPSPEVVDDRELVVLTGPPADGLIARASAKGYRLTATYPLARLDEVMVVFQTPEGVTIADAIDEIEAEVPGVTAGANHVYRLQATNPRAPTYADTLTRWPEKGCRAVQRVGMIDAGVLADHPGLADGTIVQRRFVEGASKPATDHGSLMADLLVGDGRLTSVTLYSADVVDPARNAGDGASVTAILRAVDWLRDNDVDVVNISLAGPRNKLMNRALGQASTDGMIFVAAAGNLGPTAPPQYPAAFPFALAVTAVDQNRAVFGKAVQGGHIDLAAPGVDIFVQSSGRLRVLSGTSVAAPFVTAILASDRRLQGLDISALRDRLRSQVQDLGTPGKDPVFGAGLIQIAGTCEN